MCATLSARSLSRRSFSRSVLSWFATNGRAFPWRKTREPYCIYVAEILLRRTQAERVVSPYLELISRYPTFEALSKGEVIYVRGAFKPLGLFKRADLMIAGAKIVVSDYGGILPCSVDLIMQLPGMGKYSSSAIVCLAFGMRIPMIDESSGRLLRRVLGLGSSRPAYCDQILFEAAKEVIPQRHVREFNLGLLDIAAVYCHSTRPICSICPLSEFCLHSRRSRISRTAQVPKQDVTRSRTRPDI